AKVEFEQASQRCQLLGLVVDQRRVLLEDVVSLRTGRVLQLEHGLGIEEVHFTLASPLVLAAELQLAVCPLGWSRWMGDLVTGGNLGSNLVETDATQPADGSREVLVDE